MQGKIIQQGTHNELIKQVGYYKDLIRQTIIRKRKLTLMLPYLYFFKIFDIMFNLKKIL